MRDMTDQETSMMAWNDVNDIIDDLIRVLDDIEYNHEELREFKAPIARAIANMRSERAALESKASSLRVLPTRHVSCITAACLKRDLEAILST